MSETVDCLLIGHNEMNFGEYEKMVRSMGVQSGAYKDLDMNFINIENKPCTASDVYNIFFLNDSENTQPLGFKNTFSATISYLGTYLSRRGFSFESITSFQDEKEELAQMLESKDILCVAVLTTLYVSVQPILEILSFVRKYNKTAKIIIGGPFISSYMRTQNDTSVQYLFNTTNADFYINSAQGEYALSRIINAVKNGKQYDDINNIVYKDGQTYVTTPVLLENNKLDENMVDWSLFADNMKSIVNIRTAISCPFSCTFCGFPKHAGEYQTASVESIEKELNTLDSIGKVKLINIIDDTFNVPHQRFKEVLKMFIKNKYKFKWSCNFRCQYADEETVELMKESGCQGVFLGIESGNDSILKNMNKYTTIDKYKKGIEYLNKHGLVTYASFIVGFPGETYETVQDTIDFIEQFQPTFFRTQLWFYDHITPIWQQREKYGINGSQFEWSHATMDSHVASQMIDNIFSSVKNSIWLPQNSFDFHSIFNLLSRGMDLEQLKDFLINFNTAVKEKISKKNVNVSFDVIEEFRKISMKANGILAENEQNFEYSDKFDMNFDF